MVSVNPRFADDSLRTDMFGLGKIGRPSPTPTRASPTPVCPVHDDGNRHDRDDKGIRDLLDSDDDNTDVRDRGDRDHDDDRRRHCPDEQGDDHHDDDDD